jgi:deoxyguanosine kinase
VSEKHYVAIEGPIGVGKTTLARLIHSELDAQILLEVFEENPFLSDFYADRSSYAFQTQMFFLLSRYRQQHEVIDRVLAGSSLVSDYTFAKDQLFARLNLPEDELAVYGSLHSVLSQRIPRPDLVVYLQADLDVLIERIAIRDRTYERAMEPAYLSALIGAYEEFFSSYSDSPVLAIDTNQLNIVRSEEDLQHVVERTRSALGAGTHQRPLPELETQTEAARAANAEGRRQRLSDLQRWHREADQKIGLQCDLYQDFIALQAVIGRLADELGQVWRAQAQFLPKVGNLAEAQTRALEQQSSSVKEELATSLDCLLRLANDLGVGLEDAYLERIRLSDVTTETGGGR